MPNLVWIAWQKLCRRYKHAWSARTARFWRMTVRSDTNWQGDKAVHLSLRICVVIIQIPDDIFRTFPSLLQGGQEETPCQSSCRLDTFQLWRFSGQCGLSFASFFVPWCNSFGMDYKVLMARGGGFEPPCPCRHGISNPTPYQARRSPHKSPRISI